MDGLKYAESHEWAKVGGDTATVGISDFAQARVCKLAHIILWHKYHNTTSAVYKLLPLQAELGDIVYVELPEVGSEVEKGKTFGVVESVKVGQHSHI